MATEEAAPVIVIGSGLGGALLALALGQRGIPCEVYELREDLRDNPTLSAGKSINLALSTRGLTALASVGVDGPVRAMCTPMVGRMLHDRDGKTRIQYYSADHKHHIDSVSRGGINCLLMDEAEKHPMVKFYYEHKCERVDLQNMEVHFQTKDGAKITRKAQTIFGADGFHSRVREAMMRVPRFDFSIKHLHVGYKELEFPAADSPERAVEDGKYRFKKNFLHIWPRGPFMVIALANLDGSFTVTCFFPHDGANGFDVLDKAADQAIMDFFSSEFPDAVPELPNLLRDFRANKTSPLATIKCGPWVVGGKAALLGDAAHAVVPFFGQGMNASFEDVHVLMQIFDQVQGGDRTAAVDWESIFRQYASSRKPNGDAIGDMAVENFYEMASKTADQSFLARKHVEHWLGLNFEGRYASRYELVSFSNIPYARAYEIGRVNLRICEELLAGVDTSKINSEDDVEKYCNKARAQELIDTMLPPNIFSDFSAPIPGDLARL